jgi:hypothetical protein
MNECTPLLYSITLENTRQEYNIIRPREIGRWWRNNRKRIPSFQQCNASCRANPAFSFFPVRLRRSDPFQRLRKQLYKHSNPHTCYEEWWMFVYYYFVCTINYFKIYPIFFDFSFLLVLSFARLTYDALKMTLTVAEVVRLSAMPAKSLATCRTELLQVPPQS